MGRVHHIAPEIGAVTIPAPLRDLPIFLCWRYEARSPTDTKPLKVPYYALGGRRAGRQGTTDDRARLVPFDVARREAAKRGMSGIGMALLEGYDLVALDFDNCVIDGDVSPEVLDAIGPCYAEYSPSGNGVRAILRGNLGNRKAKSTPTEYGMETFSTNGFVTLTGNPLDHIDVMGWEDRLGEVTPKLQALCDRRFVRSQNAPADPGDFTLGHAQPLGLSISEMQDLLDRIDPDMGRDEWIRVGAALHHETGGSDEGFELWHDWSAEGIKFVGEDDLRRNWESFERRVGSRQAQVTMASVKWMAQEADREAARSPISAEDALQQAQDLVGDAPRGKAETPPDFAGRFPVLRASALADQPPADWLIKGILPAADLVVVYGASGSGKSFIVLNMAAAIAHGREWRGHRTRTGRVIVIAAEGAGGYGKRLRALAHQFDLPIASLDIGVITVAPDLMQKDDIVELVAAIQAAGGADLVVVDTLAQTTPGANENSGEDMGLVLRHCKTLRTATGATVLLVHHAGKDLAKGSRGWSGIRAAADAEIEISRGDDGQRALRVTKQKDGEDGLVMGFQLETVVVGMTPDGEDLTSCIVTEAEVRPVKETRDSDRTVKRRGLFSRHVLEVMTTVDALTNALPLSDFTAMCVAALPAPGKGERDTRAQNVVRAVRALAREQDGPLMLSGDTVIFCE